MAALEAKSNVSLVKKSLPWLKRLQGALDDDDSSDSSSQPTEVTPTKASRKKSEKEDKGGARRRRLKKKRLRRLEDDSNDDASSEGSADAKEKKRKRLKKSVKMQRKRSIEAKKVEAPVDSAKTKAADSREQRMQKLHALRVTTGEHDRMAAFKLKRQESTEAFKKRERDRMRAIRAARDVQKGSVATEADVEDEGEPRRRPRPRSIDKSPKRRFRRVAASIKEDSKVEQADPPTPAVDKGSDSVQTDQDERSDVGPRIVAKAVSVEAGEHQDDKTEGVVTSPEPVKPEDDEKGQSSAATRNTSSEPVNPEGSGGEHSTVIGETSPKPAAVETSVKAEVDSPESAKRECAVQEKTEDAGTSKQMPASTQVFALTLTSIVTPVEPSKPESEAQVKTESPVVAEGAAELMENEVDGGEQAASPAVNTEDDKKISEEKEKELLLDMMPIPRKSPKEREPPAPSPRAESFVIPKRTFAKIDTARHDAVAQKERIDSAVSRTSVSKRVLDPHVAAATLPLPPPESSPTLPEVESICPQRKRTKNPVPVKSASVSTQDRSLMRLSRKRNSIFMAAAELAAQAHDINRSRKGTPARMMGYEVCDVDGKTLPDFIPRLSCATKREMSSNRESYSASFFCVSRSSPKAKGKSSSAVDECGDGDLDARTINCYEELRFERPEDREFYQRKLYGTAFVPQSLRGWITLIVRNARFERKSTGIRFNQDRDREEFAATLSKRYTFKKSVPRCDIPRENWQKLMRNQQGTVYLHYYNREDAERASHIFRDDLGQPLQIRAELNAGAQITRCSSPFPGPRLQRTPRRSSSNERSAPETSPLSSQNGSARNTPSWSKNDRYSRYDRGAPPPAPWPMGEGRYGPSVSGNKRPRALLERRSRSRSRSKSFHSLHHDSSGQECRTGPGTIKRNNAPPSDKRARSDSDNGGNGNDGKDTSAAHSDEGTPSRKRARTLPRSPRRLPTSGQGACEEDIRGGSGRQHDRGIKISPEVAPSNSVGTTDGGGVNRREVQRARSPSRRWQQEPHNASPHPRRGSFSDNSRNRPTGPVAQYRSSQQPNRGSSKPRSRSRSRPRTSSPVRGGRGGFRGDRYKERLGSREFGRGGPSDNNARGQRMHSDRGRGGYNNRGGGANSRPRR